MAAREYAMRTESKYWEIEEELIRRHQHSTDSGLITYWAPTHCKQPWFGGAPDCSQRTSEPTAPTMLIEQIASEFVLPLLPKKTQEQVCLLASSCSLPLVCFFLLACLLACLIDGFLFLATVLEFR